MNRCSWCKFVAITIIYIVLGKLRITLMAINGALGEIGDAVEGVMNISSKIVQAAIARIRGIQDRTSPYRIAGAICEEIGYCP